MKNNILYIQDCWKKCGNSYCCTNNHEDFNFSFIKKNSTEIIYTPREYLKFESTKKTFNNQFSKKPKIVKIDIGDFYIGVIYTRCDLKGLCSNIIDKPLLCDLYPYLPHYDDNLLVKSYGKASVFDKVFETINTRTPCAIDNIPQKDDIYNSFDSYIKFYIQVANIYLENMSSEILKSPLIKHTGKNFWEKWELHYLTGKLFNKEKFISKIKSEYLKFKNKDKNFTLEEESRRINEVEEIIKG